MANYMIVRQRVTDLSRFQITFDRLKPGREAAGLTDLGHFCAADEPDVVIVVMEVEDISRTKQYWHSHVLAQGRTEAGIVGPIDTKSDQVWLTDGLVKDRPQTGRFGSWHLGGWRALAEGQTDDYENSSCKRKAEKGI